MRHWEASSCFWNLRHETDTEMGWCGKTGEHWAIGGTLNPCYFNTAASLALLALAVVVCAQQLGRAKRLLALGGGRARLWAAPPAPGACCIQTAGVAVLALLHSLALGFVADRVRTEVLRF